MEKVEQMKKLTAFAVITAFLMAGEVGIQAQEKIPPAKAAAITDARAAAEKTSAQPQAEQAGPSTSRIILSKAALYVPNLFLDALDTFSLDLMFGAMTELDARITRAYGFGWYWGPYFGAFKEYHRQYGFALTRGWYGQATFFQAEDMERVHAVGPVQEYWQFGSNFPLPSQPIYNMRNGARDYWSLEVSLALFAGAKVGIHPIEVLDFLGGIFAYDVTAMKFEGGFWKSALSGWTEQDGDDLHLHFAEY